MSEHKMTKKDEEEKEDIVKGMKKNFSGFRKRYGKDAKDVMYATATKMAMKEDTISYVNQKVFHDIFGEGIVLNDFSQLNEQGKIDWYSVKFNHGIETAFTEDIVEMIDRLKQVNDNSVEEELSGNQHKIDANKNNKIDAHDFKLLRKLKKARG
tara:strand:+ start:1362 stop:1823 length:462 start_codon:yes stop_codon:yes gene_type:complete